MMQETQTHPDVAKALEIEQELDTLDAEFQQEQNKLVAKYELLKTPIYKKRNKAVEKVDQYWKTVFMNHPLVEGIVMEKEWDVLGKLKNMRVERNPDVPVSFKLVFEFEPNDYFEGTEIIKQVVVNPGEESPSCVVHDIKWKKGKSLVEQEAEASTEDNKRKHGDDQSESKKKAKLEDLDDMEGLLDEFAPSVGFFNWILDQDEDSAELATVFADDVYPQACKYFLGMHDDDDEELEDDEEEEEPEQ